MLYLPGCVSSIVLSESSPPTLLWLWMSPNEKQECWNSIKHSIRESSQLTAQAALGIPTEVPLQFAIKSPWQGSTG